MFPRYCHYVLIDLIINLGLHCFLSYFIFIISVAFVRQLICWLHKRSHISSVPNMLAKITDVVYTDWNRSSRFSRVSFVDMNYLFDLLKPKIHFRKFTLPAVN